MDRWQNKIAVVTGASAGIGAAVVKDLVKAGLVVIGLARRVERVRDLGKDLPPELVKNLHAVQCDVSKEDEVKKKSLVTLKPNLEASLFLLTMQES